MAIWNNNKPADNDYINVSAQHIRENFNTSIWGAKRGLEIYYYGSDDIRITPGFIHVNDGSNDYGVVKTSETELTGESGLGAQWYYVTIDTSGTVTLRSATGAATERPTDAYFQWSGYNHAKQGYYYDTDERIIGAVYRVNATTWYIINCGEGGAESGKNEYGEWKRTADGEQWCYRILTCDYVSSFTIRGTWLFPVSFMDTQFYINYTATDDIGLDKRETHFRLGTFSISSVILDIMSNGAFQSGDTCNVHVSARGRYK
ncbi:MAG: hypothetical protein JRI54_00140 [Deltaproteobacteria bacterium]|nr:hypothetical protein [Deltaproteobacteria bacterium]